MGRIPVLTTFRTGDEVQDRNFDHIKQTLNPVLRNPLFAAADFRWLEVQAATATGTPTFALQYRTQETWATILTLNSVGGIVTTATTSSIAQPAWTTVTFQNSWADFNTATYPAASYFKDTSGVVRVRGRITTGSIGNTAFTLPSGYRPSKQQQFACASNSAYGECAVAPGGQVTPIIGNNTYFHLDTISFDTR